MCSTRHAVPLTPLPLLDVYAVCKQRGRVWIVALPTGWSWGCRCWAEHLLQATGKQHRKAAASPPGTLLELLFCRNIPRKQITQKHTHSLYNPLVTKSIGIPVTQYGAKHNKHDHGSKKYNEPIWKMPSNDCSVNFADPVSNTAAFSLLFWFWSDTALCFLSVLERFWTAAAAFRKPALHYLLNHTGK